MVFKLQKPRNKTFAPRQLAFRTREGGGKEGGSVLDKWITTGSRSWTSRTVIEWLGFERAAAINVSVGPHGGCKSLLLPLVDYTLLLSEWVVWKKNCPNVTWFDDHIWCAATNGWTLQSHAVSVAENHQTQPAGQRWRSAIFLCICLNVCVLHI